MNYSCGLVPQLSGGGSVKRGTTIRKSFSSKQIGGAEWHIRTQFTEQLKCLDSKVELDNSILSELIDYYKRRAEVEKNYSDQLNSLAKTIRSRHSLDAKKREYVAGNIWQVLVASTTELAQEHRNIADVLDTQMVTRLCDIQDDCTRIHHETRDSLESCQRRILNSISNLQNLMSSYYDQMALLSQAFKVMEKSKKSYLAIEKKKKDQGKPVAKSKRVLKAKNEYEAKLGEFEKCRSETTRARNEYLLQLCGTNSGLETYYRDEIPDYMDCLLMGFHNSVARSLLMHVSCEESVCATRSSICQLLQGSVTTLEMHQDKTTLLSKHACFRAIPSFDFLKHKDDEVTEIYADPKLKETLMSDVACYNKTLQSERLEIDEMFKTLTEAEKTIMELIDQRDFDVQHPHVDASAARKHSNPMILAGSGTLPEIGNSGLPPSHTSSLSHGSNTRRSTSITSQNHSASPVNLAVYTTCRNGTRDRRIDTEKFYLDKFNEYVNLKHRTFVTSRKLEILEKALKAECYQNAAAVAAAIAARRFASNSPNLNVDENTSIQSGSSGKDIDSKTEKSSLTKMSLQAMHAKRSPKLFGGTIDEYVKYWGLLIPPVVTSCIRIINLYGMNHQGIFRVPGSQVDMNTYRERFENLEDPFQHLNGTRDINAVAGVLKLYFRELSQAPFPPDLFEDIRMISRKENNKVEALRELVRKRLSKPVYITIRYLFGFLKHLSEHSDENMMDAINLSICFGPGIIAIPEHLDPVQNQGIVNDTVRNLIEHYNRIFSHSDIHGPAYDRFTVDNGILGIPSSDPPSTSPITSSPSQAVYRIDSFSETGSTVPFSSSISLSSTSFTSPYYVSSRNESKEEEDEAKSTSKHTEDEPELDEDDEVGDGHATVDSSEMDTQSQHIEMEADETIMTMSSVSSIGTAGSLDFISIPLPMPEVAASSSTQPMSTATSDKSPPSNSEKVDESAIYAIVHSSEKVSFPLTKLRETPQSVNKLPTRLEPDGEESLSIGASHQFLTPSDENGSDARPRSVVHLARLFDQNYNVSSPTQPPVHRNIANQHTSFQQSSSQLHSNTGSGLTGNDNAPTNQLSAEEQRLRYRSLPQPAESLRVHAMENNNTAPIPMINDVAPSSETNVSNKDTNVPVTCPDSKSIDEAIDSSSDPARLEDSDFTESQSPHSFLRESSNDDEIDIDTGLESVRRQLKNLRLEHAQSSRSVVFDNQSQKFLHLPPVKQAPDLVLDVYAQQPSLIRNDPGTTAERFANEETVTMQRRAPGNEAHFIGSLPEDENEDMEFPQAPQISTMHVEGPVLRADQPLQSQLQQSSGTALEGFSCTEGVTESGGFASISSSTKVKPPPPTRAFPQPQQTHFTQL